MGVPKLWSYVAQRNLGHTTAFPIRKKSDKTSTEKLFDDVFDVTHLIFDAPSFAYWFWREAHLRQEEYFRYSQLLGVFIHNLIDNGNFKLTFLFDGGLPPSKQAVRETRYQSLLAESLQQGKSKKHSPPAFVVCICQQTLNRLADQLQFRVCVVHGEADDFCIRLARANEPALVVSADADFLIYTSEVGSFVPLQTFPLQWEDTLYLDVYTALRASLGIKRTNGLVEVAALLNEDTTLGVSEAIHKVLRNRTLDHISQDTLQQYTTTYTVSKEFVPTPQIQETIYSGIYFGRLTELFFSSATERAFWLPFLPTTTPPRRSPWIISRPIRQQTYYELRKRGVISGTEVVEMIQRGNRVVGEIIPIEKADITTSESMTREEMFISTMTILLKNVQETELVYLPYFAPMFLLLQSPDIQLSFAEVPAAMQYVILQYQTILYSFTILLQSRQPNSTRIPEFATLWDMTYFKTAMVKEVPEGKELWNKITRNMDEEVKQLWDVHKIPLKKRKNKKGGKEVNQVQELHFDGNNRFSSLEITDP